MLCRLITVLFMTMQSPCDEMGDHVNKSWRVKGGDLLQEE